jgi:PEP-CTERM motif
MKTIVQVCVCLVLTFGCSAASQAGIVTFDDLASPPATDSATSLFNANNNSDLYHGVVWDSRVNVVGDAFRVDPVTPGPLFGIPHSGHFFITNGGQSNDGILLSTNQILMGAWFGQNEYFGFGSGADQVTINALSGANVLASVVFDLPPPSTPGRPGLMGFADTSSFASLTGITGYRIDRREVGAQRGNWVADDFSFALAGVPEPSSLVLAALGLAACSGTCLIQAIRRRNKEPADS